MTEYNKKQRQEEIKNSLADEKHKQDALTALDQEYKRDLGKRDDVDMPKNYYKDNDPELQIGRASCRERV